MTLRPLAVVAVLVALALSAQAQEIQCTNGSVTLPTDRPNDPSDGPFACSNVDLVGYMPRAAFALPGSPAIDHNDIWGWTDPQTGVEYALVGTENGLGFVDLSTPSMPRLVAKMPTTRASSAWRDVKVYADHAFVVADSSPEHGVQVFDLGRLRGMSGAAQLVQPDVVYDKISSAHNIVIDEETGYAYVVGFRYSSGGRVGRGLPPSCDVPGFHVINIQDPLNPTFVTCFSDAAQESDPYVGVGYTHDAQCLVYRGPDADYQGREMCFGANEDVVTTFDVTDKQNVRIVSQGEYPNDVYTHQGWLTEDQRYFLLNDEIDESALGINQRTIVMDMSDLDAPEVAFIYDSGLTSIDHNLYTRGHFAFESNYETGLRILDLSDIGIGTATEVAYFDTYPQRDAVAYHGNWSNYPYFASGLIVANDIDNGFFVLRPTTVSFSTDSAEAPDVPVGYTLSDPYPNPTAEGARLTLRVEESQQVRAELFDVAGRRVALVYVGVAGPGAEVTMEVAGTDLPAGVYVVRVTGERFETSRRLVLTR